MLNELLFPEDWFDTLARWNRFFGSMESLMKDRLAELFLLVQG